MAAKDDWTIGDMQEELEEVVKSWSAKMPVLGSSKEMTVAKQMYQTVESVGKILGREANADALANMSRADKLKAALAAESTVEDINILVQQFETMSLMHKVVRRRHLEGKKIPETAEAVQAIMQVEAQQMLSKDQKKKMVGRTKDMMRKARRR